MSVTLERGTKLETCSMILVGRNASQQKIDFWELVESYSRTSSTYQKAKVEGKKEMKV